jgi:hypothetical protein
MLKFDTTCIKEDHLGYYVREIKFSPLLLFNLLISTYLNPPKINFKLYICIEFSYYIFVFQYLIIIKVMRNDKEFTIYPHVYIYHANNY